jgi:hypothetical protein
VFGDRADTRHGDPQSATRSVVTCGLAESTSPASAPLGRPQIKLKARAHRMNNRNREAAERYMQGHAILMTGKGR